MEKLRKAKEKFPILFASEVLTERWLFSKQNVIGGSLFSLVQ